FEDKRLRVAVCAGVAEMIDGESVDQWLQRADNALYRSKEVGRNCGHWMDGDLAVRIEPTDRKPAASGENLPSAEQPESAHPLAERPSETPDPSSQPTSAGQKKVDPGSFAYLPDRETLGNAFKEMRARTPTVSMYVMSVHCGDSANQAAMRSLLQIVRATMRSVDRIGCEDDATLLVCMPSIDKATALERGKQICRSAQAIQLGGPSQDQQVTIGLARLNPEEEYEEVVSQATRLAQQPTDEENALIRVQGEPVTS
ncbi:MAG: hypothetical protein MI861_07475, partial [Pirellulales bacterium]|nr:hypothetical protein [Pirellulales bacterium]